MELNVFFDPLDEVLDCEPLTFRTRNTSVELKRTCFSWTISALKEFLRVTFEMTHGKKMQMRSWILGQSPKKFLSNRGAMRGLEDHLSKIVPTPFVEIDISACLRTIFQECTRNLRSNCVLV